MPDPPPQEITDILAISRLSAAFCAAILKILADSHGAGITPQWASLGIPQDAVDSIATLISAMEGYAQNLPE